MIGAQLIRVLSMKNNGQSIVGIITRKLMLSVLVISAQFIFWYAPCARAGDEVIAWGDLSYDRAFGARHERNASVVQIAAGDFHSLALKSDGDVVAWGDNHFGQTSIPARGNQQQAPR